MRKIIVFAMVTLDGVMQAPGGPEEDTSGGFKFGGWTEPFGDEVYAKIVKKELEPAEYLLGRKTFEIWENYWPRHHDFWPGINSGAKYVMSLSRNTTSWNHTTFIQRKEEVVELKKASGMDLHVWGSSELVHFLLENDLVDEIRLKIHPLILGKGKKLFGQAMPTAFILKESLTTPLGVIIAHYQRKSTFQLEHTAMSG